MRKNLPVTNIEYPLNEETLIVSKTDLKGKLTYFNDQFVAAANVPLPPRLLVHRIVPTA